MEDALAPARNFTFKAYAVEVLILVLMEDALAPGKFPHRRGLRVKS